MVKIQAMTPNVGAEISGLDVRCIDRFEETDLKKTLKERKLVVIRDQALSPEEYADFCRRLGEPVREDLVLGSGRPAEVGVIHIRQNERQKINFWHMDHSFRNTPSAYIMLYAVQLPPCGGDTLFASLEAAYQGLDDSLKKEIVGLHAEHRYTETQNSRRRFTPDEIARASVAEGVVHPLVGQNQETGRPLLFVNTPVYCRSIAERRDEDGGRLLRKLYRHAQKPEFHVRVRWKKGTLVVWENAHCLHYPVSDYFPHERLLWRVVVPGSLGPPIAYTATM